ncbi:MAG: DUF5658 family protein [Coriobacteriia bacterium]|nr:DUF5658 family protein [Coriobacteriia bacterium]
MKGERVPDEAPGAPEAPWDGIERRSGIKRRRRRVYRFVDRRSGFDRRRRYPVLGTMRDHPWTLVVLLVLLNLLSLLDGAFTAVELAFGLAAEGNPILNAAVQRSPWLAVAVKIGAMIVVTYVIWHGRRKRIILVLALLSLALFGAVVAYHWGTFWGMGWI